MSQPQQPQGALNESEALRAKGETTTQAPLDSILGGSIEHADDTDDHRTNPTTAPATATSAHAHTAWRLEPRTPPNHTPLPAPPASSTTQNVHVATVQARKRAAAAAAAIDCMLRDHHGSSGSGNNSSNNNSTQDTE